MPAHASPPSPDVPAVVAGHGRAAVLTGEGELLTLPTEDAAGLVRAAGAALVVHAPALAELWRVGGEPKASVVHLKQSASVREVESRPDTDIPEPGYEVDVRGHGWVSTGSCPEGA